jgi:UDP-3-O-[3-hydroxymyristoyl] glucosamine N-acyltransferase
MTLGEIAGRLGCRLASRDGCDDSALPISGVAGMEHATTDQLTFLANPKYAPKVRNTRAAAILASAPVPGIATLVSENPYLDFARALELFYRPPRPRAGIHPTAAIAPTATVAEDASIGPYAVIGENVRVGRRTVIHPHAVIYEGGEIGDDCELHSGAVVREFCRLGDRVVLQNNVVVGGDGYGFARRADGTHYKIVQAGPAVIEDDVEIQALSNIDRATVGETRVRRGAKIDSLVQVGHACVVGEDNIICSQTGLAGSSILEKNVLLAGQVGISGHLTIHDNAVVYAQSGIGGDVEKGAVMSGSPAFDAATWRRAVAAFPKLPDLVKAVRQLEKRLSQIQNKNEGTDA